MKNITKTFFWLLLLTSFSINAQNKFTISGYVNAQKTGEELIGASILVNELKNIGTTTNAYGFYSLTIPEGNYTFVSQFIGCKTNTIQIKLNQNIKHNFILSENVTSLNEVVVTAQKSGDNITKERMGVEKIDIQEIKNIPVIFGEKDILKTIQLLPGVKSAGEGNSGFFIRGGTSDQNLILLDEAIVYNASHLLGFFSVFNSDAIKDVTLYKGGQPAEFGGRLSSVLDIKMNEGNDKKFGVEGGLGLISSRLKIEGPIVKDKGSFTLTGRRSYADLFLKFSKDSAMRERRLYFYDFNAKANYRINENNRIFLSGYFGTDILQFGTKMGVDWGNKTGTLRWNHLFNEKLFSNTSLVFSNYDYNITTNLAGTDGEIISRIQDYNLKQDFQYYASSKSKIKFGLYSNYHKIIPGAITLKSDSSISELNLPHKQALENALYFTHDYKLSELVNFEYGVRFTSFTALGAGDFYTYNSLGETIDTTSYNRGEIVKTYLNVEPRFSMNFIINEKSSIKAGYGRNTQNLHLLSNSTSGNPTDLWLPSSNNVKPEIADQVSLGYFRNFKSNMFEFSSEIYYKNLQNQIDYKDGAELRFNENAENQLIFGSGRAYGVELYLKKKTGKFTGWLSYTLAKTEKKIDGINSNEYYPAKQDRTHDISIVGIYELSNKLSFSATWVFYTGNAVTFPSGKYEIAGQTVNYYTERNGYRMPTYHRLDLGLTWQRKKTEKFESSWNFSLYNAYGRKNAYTISFEEDPTDPTKTVAIQTTLFQWIPSITYNFKF
ncbi:MAG: collagen-binding protein [Bacteroidetes bacterium GWA2_31_9]|nr:MAG: collagen-binding protein [Bacteroidetes bacterium GWA2_31_9]